nr:retrovirus-related Pol polyprotein from transposon TNT 1-94 [Tanacetum cinerariifolium]
MPNNSQVKLKKTQVEDHPRIPSISNKINFVTACNDTLNSRTSNANAVCATCGKCLVDSDHFACVTKMLNDVNATTKKPNVVPISIRKPKGNVNKSVATPYKKKVASKSNTQKPKSYYRMLVYYVKGLNHNLFSVGQFCDADLEVAFRKSTCFVRDLQGNDLLTADAHVPSQQELALLFGPLYDEFFTTEPTNLTNANAKENNDNQVEHEFTNPFCTPVQEVAESSSYNIGNSNVHTFNQPQVSEYRWTKDHPLEQVRGNPSKSVQTRLQVWELVDKPCGKMVIRLKWLWKNKKDEDQTVIHNKARLVAKGPLKEEVYVVQPKGSVDPDHPEKVYRYDELSKFLTSKCVTKGLQIHQSPRGIFINQAKYALEILHKHGMEKGQSIGTPMATKPKLDADLSGNLVDQTDYRSKIKSLMYLTSSRPDIVQAICYYARYQSRPTDKHIKEMLITPDALILTKALLEEYNS